MALGTASTLLVLVYLMFVLYVGAMSGRGKRRNSSILPPLSEAPAKRRSLEAGENALMGLCVADRAIGPAVATASLTATWTGGSYLSDIAYLSYLHGFAWAHLPVGCGLALIIGGRFLAAKVRQRDYITVLDVFDEHVGRYSTFVFMGPVLIGELIWSASMLSFVGFVFQDMANVSAPLAAIFMTCFVLTYTTLGGCYSVVHTGAVQLITCSIGMWICVPFCMSHHNVGTLKDPEVNLPGAISTEEAIRIFDIVCATALGGIARQEFFQGVLCSDKVVTAKISSYLSGFGCILAALPPIIVGSAAKSTNFTAISADQPARLVGTDVPYRLLPYAMERLTPAVLGPLLMAALVSSALCSLASGCLALGSVATHNVYRALLRPTAQESEVCWVFRLSIVASGALSLSVSRSLGVTAGQLRLCADLAYVTLFPQLLAAFYLPSNAYGCLAGFAAATLLRALCGVPEAGLPAVVRLPLFDEQLGEQRFPFRTTCMLVSVTVILIASAIFRNFTNMVIVLGSWLPNTITTAPTTELLGPWPQQSMAFKAIKALLRFARACGLYEKLALISSGLMPDVLGAKQQKPAIKADAAGQPSAAARPGGRSRQPPPSPPAAQEPATPSRVTTVLETTAASVAHTEGSSGSPSRQKDAKATISAPPSPGRSSGTGSPVSTTRNRISATPVSLERISEDSRNGRRFKKRQKVSSVPSIGETASEPPPTTVHTIRL